MTVNSFNVTASCASGYKGKASVSVCKDVDEPYSLGGCEPEKCTEPSARDTEGYELTPFSLMRPSFSVSVKCTSGIGHGKAKECTKDGEPYTVEGCYIGECTSPRKDLEEGYVVCPVGRKRERAREKTIEKFAGQDLCYRAAARGRKSCPKGLKRRCLRGVSFSHSRFLMDCDSMRQGSLVAGD